MVHIPKEKRSKLEPKSVECIFLGYSSVSKAYRLYNNETKKIIVSRDVIFFEDKRKVTSENVQSNNVICLPVPDDYAENNPVRELESNNDGNQQSEVDESSSSTYDDTFTDLSFRPDDEQNLCEESIETELGIRQSERLIRKDKPNYKPPDYSFNNAT